MKTTTCLDSIVHYVASQINECLQYSHFNIKIGLMAARMSDAIVHQIVTDDAEDIMSVQCPKNMSGYVYSVHERILCVGMQPNQPGVYVNIVTCRVHDMIKELASAVADDYTVSVLLVDQFNYRGLQDFMSIPSITEINVEPHMPLSPDYPHVMYRLTPRTLFISSLTGQMTTM